MRSAIVSAVAEVCGQWRRIDDFPGVEDARWIERLLDLPERRVETGSAGIWSSTYYRVARAFAIRSADQGRLNQIEDFHDKTVIVTPGSAADIDLRNRANRAGITSLNIEGTDDEEAAAIKVRDGVGIAAPFAYAGGLGSIEFLVKELGGLSIAWPHCLMTNDGTEVSEPFDVT